MNLSWTFFKKYILSKNANSITRRISFFCFLGISISVLAMTVIVSVMNGFGEAIEKRLLNFEPHVVVQLKENLNIKEQEQKLIKLKNELNLISETQKKSTHFQLVYQDQVILRTVDGQYSGAVARGYFPQDLEFFISKISKESSLTQISSEVKVNSGDVYIGSDLAYQLGVFLGDQIILTPPETLLLPLGEVPETKKLFVTDLIRSGVQSLDGQFLYYARGEASLFQDSISHEALLEVRFDNLNELDFFLAQIPLSEFKYSTWQDRNSALFYSLKMEKFLITFFLLLSILVGSFSIITILILLATQKRKEIAILLTLGMSSKTVSRILTQIGFLLSGCGVLLGFFLGLLVCLFLDSTHLIQLPDIYYDRTLPIKFVPGFYIFVICVSLFISLLASYLPAKWFLKFNPNDLMKGTF